LLLLTSNIKRLYSSEANVTLNGEQHKMMADQITTVSKERLKERLGMLNSDDIRAVEHAI
jgi:mRNA interferase MazF